MTNDKPSNKISILKQMALARAEQLLAIELLEYHNKNFLSGDNKTRSEDKQEIIKTLIQTLETM